MALALQSALQTAPRKTLYYRLLLVGSDPWATHHLRALLLRRKYMVTVAHTAVTARAMLATSSHDVLVIDLSLQGLDGLALCRQLRADGLNLPVLMVHERASIADLLEGFDAGADAYLLGPYVPSLLYAELGALLRREDSYVRLRPAANH
jgi:two-component system response regulator MprA